MTNFEKESARNQFNFGPGPLIGGDMHGDIRYEMLDFKTKNVLAKLSEDAPNLADLLKRALCDGVISPDVVAALQSAVRNINEDVASALMFAGQNINEDVANSLQQAGVNINADVAAQILQGAEKLGEARRDLDHTLSSLNTAVEKIRDENRIGGVFEAISTITGSAEWNGRADFSRTSRFAILKIRAKAFILDFALGALTVFILIHANLKLF